MAARLSTGLVNKLMDTGSFKSLFALGFIDVYSGPQPTSADDAATGTKLVTIYSNGVSTGLSFETNATNGELEKASGESWSGTAIASGTAGWFRLREAGDSGVSASSTAVRYDGAIATAGAEMNLGSLVITSGAPFTIGTAAFTLVKSA